MALLPANFSWLRPSVLDLESGTGQTESRTDDGHRRFMPHPGGNIVIDLACRKLVSRTSYTLNLHVKRLSVCKCFLRPVETVER